MNVGDNRFVRFKEYLDGYICEKCGKLVHRDDTQLHAKLHAEERRAPVRKAGP